LAKQWKSANRIENDLGITHGLLAKWKQRAQADGQEAFPGKGRMTAEQARIRELERELIVAKQERDILKKAVAIFGKDEK
jgi:transposase